MIIRRILLFEMRFRNRGCINSRFYRKGIQYSNYMHAINDVLTPRTTGTTFYYIFVAFCLPGRATGYTQLYRTHKFVDSGRNFFFARSCRPKA